MTNYILRGRIIVEERLQFIFETILWGQYVAITYFSNNLQQSAIKLIFTLEQKGYTFFSIDLSFITILENANIPLILKFSMDIFRISKIQKISKISSISFNFKIVQNREISYRNYK